MVNSITTPTTSLTQMQGPPAKPSASDMMQKMSKDAGGDGSSISKDQLESLISKMESEGKDTSPMKDMLSKFDDISSDGKTISSGDLDKAMQSGTLEPPKGGKPPAPRENDSATSSRYDFQDPDTITADQLEPPIDIKV